MVATEKQIHQAIREARFRLRQWDAEFGRVMAPSDPTFLPRFQQFNSVACWFSAESEPDFYAIACDFEGLHDPGPEPDRVVTEALRTW